MHPESEHGLQIQLATALRERDQMALRAEHFAARILATESALAAARRECEDLRAIVRKYGTHRQSCAAFPVVSEAQIERDCNCGLIAALASPAAGEEGTHG